MSRDKKDDIFIKGYLIFLVLVLFFLCIILNFASDEPKNKQYQYSEYGYIKVYRISENIDEGIRVYRNADNPSSICGFLEPGNVVMVVEETENEDDEETCYKLVNDDGYIFTSSYNMIEVTVLNPN